jgi:hypothetical protein
LEQRPIILDPEYGQTGTTIQQLWFLWLRQNQMVRERQNSAMGVPCLPQSLVRLAGFGWFAVRRDITGDRILELLRGCS